VGWNISQVTFRAVALESVSVAVAFAPEFGSRFEPGTVLSVTSRPTGYLCTQLR